MQHVHLGHGPGLYALAGRHRGWAVCEACGALRDARRRRAPPTVREAVERATGFDARFSHFPIVGVCAGCRRKETRHAHP